MSKKFSFPGALSVKQGSGSQRSLGLQRTGALLIIRKVPDIEFLPLSSHNWCVLSVRKGGPLLLQAATAKI